MTRKLIPLETEWTNPYFRPYINVCEWIKDGSAGRFTGDRLVVQERLIELLCGDQHVKLAIQQLGVYQP